MNYFTMFVVLVILTNMFTNIIKDWGGIFAAKPKIVVVVVAELLTMAVTVAYIQLMSVAAVWYHYAGGTVAGGVVAYVAMYGYDGWYEDLVAHLKGLRKKGGSV